MAIPHGPSAREFFELLRDSANAWWQDNCMQLGAALAYYTLFSIAPLLLIAIALTALVYGEALASGELMSKVEDMAGAEAAQTIREMVEGASQPRQGLLATAAGLVMTIVGASSVFGQLQASLNFIWNVPSDSGGSWSQLLIARLTSFSMILVIGFLLLVSIAIGSAIGALSGPLSSWFPGGHWIARALDLLVAFATTTFLFAMIFKILPDLRIPWSDVWVGAAFTSVLFALGRVGISFYLGQSSTTSVYGAASSIIVILLWIYYSSQLLFFGAEFTHTYARRFGSGASISRGPAES